MWTTRQKDDFAVVVRLTYVNPDNGKIQEFERPMDRAALEDFFNDLVQRYMVWLSTLAQWTRLRDQSINRLAFPFRAYRSGQRDMAVAVYRTIREKNHLLVQAATGIGKTMAALFPAVKALGDQLAAKVVFLTARTTGRLAAESALQALMDKGLRIKDCDAHDGFQAGRTSRKALAQNEWPCVDFETDRRDQIQGRDYGFSRLRKVQMDTLLKSPSTTFDNISCGHPNSSK